MGMYTQLFLDLTLKEDTPKQIIETLNDMIDNVSDYWKEKKRLNWCFNSSSYYFNNNHYSQITYDKIGEQYRLFVLCDFKNYEDEIDTLLKWLKPHIDDECDDFIGYQRYEEDEQPTLIFRSKIKLEEETK